MRTPDEKLAYADGFREAIKWFENNEVEPGLIERAYQLHDLMEKTTEPPPAEPEPEQ